MQYLTTRRSLLGAGLTLTAAAASPFCIAAPPNRRTT
jgi:hypothetical protein